jgi:hypothetical protein
VIVFGDDQVVLTLSIAERYYSTSSVFISSCDEIGAIAEIEHLIIVILEVGMVGVSFIGGHGCVYLAFLSDLWKKRCSDGCSWGKWKNK